MTRAPAQVRRPHGVTFPWGVEDRRPRRFFPFLPVTLHPDPCSRHRMIKFCCSMAVVGIVDIFPEDEKTLP